MEETLAPSPSPLPHPCLDLDYFILSILHLGRRRSEVDYDELDEKINRAITHPEGFSDVDFDDDARLYEEALQEERDKEDEDRELREIEEQLLREEPSLNDMEVEKRARRLQMALVKKRRAAKVAELKALQSKEYPPTLPIKFSLLPLSPLPQPFFPPQHPP